MQSIPQLCSPKIICFDADDTLWYNEEYYQAAEQKFSELLADYCTKEEASKTLFAAEMNNLDLLGYGTKSFIISMVEAALDLTKQQLPNSLLKELILLGKENIAPPMDLLPNVKEVLTQLSCHYSLALATKGDLRDQERKLERSGLQDFFMHVAILSEKNREAYAKILRQLSIDPHEFMMVGNSFKSDILPVLEIGGRAVYIPSAVLWAHEKLDPIEHDLLHTIDRIDQLPGLLKTA